MGIFSSITRTFDFRGSGLGPTFIPGQIQTAILGERGGGSSTTNLGTQPFISGPNTDLTASRVGNTDNLNTVLTSLGTELTERQTSQTPQEPSRPDNTSGIIGLALIGALGVYYLMK